MAFRALLDAGDAVWVEEPGYPGAHRALALGGHEAVPVPVDGEGLNVEEGIRRCPSARAVFITPSHQYPLGMTLSAGRRMQLLAWAQRSGAWIIEDDYDSEYRAGVRPIASVQGLDIDDRVIYAGTFSKVLFPALRMGYLVLPEDLVPVLRAVRDATDLFAPVLYQRALADFIREGQLARHISRMRALYAERREHMIAAIKRHLGPSFEIESAAAGMHLVVRLPHGIDDRKVAQRAAAAGISCMVLSACCLEPPRQNGLILGYGGVETQRIDACMRQLAGAVRAARRSA
jgi:GntR family transcriptional regulator/MocR family aminotransferase